MAPFSSAACSMLARVPRPITVACDAPPSSAICSARMLASGSSRAASVTPKKSMKQWPATVRASGDRSS
jgi:hypothetical protein